MSQFSGLLAELHRKHLANSEGKLADYIPELSKADPGKFAIAIATVDGAAEHAGDADTEFTLQSISKPFVFGVALEAHGREALRAKVGVEPTGDAFNSIIELEEKSHRPYNPMINSGAIAVTSLVPGADPDDKLGKLLSVFSAYSGRQLTLDGSVFVSERATGNRNRAIAHLLRHFGVIDSDLDAVLDLYFQQCSIRANTHDLARMAATLAHGGVNPVSGERVLPKELVRDILSLMFTCGMYDSSGEWAYTVGLPAKSGVSGGVLAVVPGRMGIAAYSPLLDACGHSVRGVAALKDLAAELKLGIFD